MQDLPRLHVEPDEHRLAADMVLPIPPGQAHHLGDVLRRQPGDGVRLFNARDGEWDGTIEALRKGRGSIRLVRQVRLAAPEPGPTLLFAPLKRDATDLVVRMATELGVASLQPVLTERTNTARINADRWRAIAVEAAEQCERLSIPEIAPLLRLPELLRGWDPQRALLVAIERAAERLVEPAFPVTAWRARATPGLQPGILVGPEGGFSAAELALLRTCPGVVPVSLGPLVLRAETAALAAVAALRI